MKCRRLEAFGLAVVVFALASCASSGSASKSKEPLQNSVTLEFLSEPQVLSAFGHDYSQNPFVAPKGTVLPKTWDYIVAQLHIVTETGAKVTLLGSEIVDKDGKVRAWFYDRQTFADFVASVSPDDLIRQKRIRVVNWWFLPSNEITLKRGDYAYVMVFMGKHPIPEELEAHVRLMIDDEEKDFDAAIPSQG